MPKPNLVTIHIVTSPDEELEFYVKVTDNLLNYFLNTIYILIYSNN